MSVLRQASLSGVFEWQGSTAHCNPGTRAQVLPGSYSIAPNVSEGIQNLRSGPGQGHSIVIAIPAGRSGVIVHECRSPDDGQSRFQWCRAQWNGYSGWI